jgi:hypothetical protein
MQTRLPTQIQSYFWGDNVDELNWSDHKKYIIQTLLEKGNTEALSWLFKQTTKKELQELLPQLKLQPKSSNFWRIYTS